MVQVRERSDVGGAPHTRCMLTDLQTRMIEFERGWLGRRGAKNAAIIAEFGWRPVTYYRRLDELVQSRAAAEADPMLCRVVLERMDRVEHLRVERRVA